MPKTTKPAASPATKPARPARKVVVLPDILTPATPTPQPAPIPTAPKSDAAPHLIIQARAGTGKTTTLIEGLNVLLGKAPKITPSEQQAAIWDSLLLSRGKARTITFVAFNKSIADELQRRVPAGVVASTMHSLGYKAVRNRLGNVKVNQYRLSDIVCDVLGKDPYEVRSKHGEVLRAVCDLVSKCKMNLVGELVEDKYEVSEEDLDTLAAHYGIELNGSRAEVYRLVPLVLTRCAIPAVQTKMGIDNAIDYDDMVWLPVVMNFPIWRSDLLLVDEFQDLNRCQQALAKMAGERLIGCGDDKQAIYGFAGADAESMSRMYRELSQTPRGCVLLPLTVTRRCGKAIVLEANKIVPDFSAHETNGPGSVRELGMLPKGDQKVFLTDDGYKLRQIGSVFTDDAQWTDGNSTFDSDENGMPFDGDGPLAGEITVEKSKYYRGHVEAGNMILCRVNAPLVSECFKFLREGRKANIQGRDVARGLTSTVAKAKCDLVIDLVGYLNEWLQTESQKELKKRNPSEDRLIAFQDRFDCLMTFCEGLRTVKEVLAKIDSVFTDDPNVPGIRLSSVHKAKGLEADRVFILLPKKGGMPHPMAKSPWAREQEMNLKYVAITRAIKELVWVTDDRPSTDE